MGNNTDDPVLNADRVHELFRRCLVPDAEHSGTDITGIVTRARFSPQALAEHSGEIRVLLAELPDGFRRTGGGGWTFLKACDDRHGNQWTGFHRTMEELFMLGLGAGLVTELAPRELWADLPGGMPYYMIDM